MVLGDFFRVDCSEIYWNNRMDGLIFKTGEVHKEYRYSELSLIELYICNKQKLR